VEAFVRYSLTMDVANLQQRNIDPKTVSWDWDTLTQLQQELSKKADNGSIAVIGVDPLDAMGGGFGGGNPFYWGQAWGIEYFDEHAGTFNFNNDQLIEAMNTVKKIYDLVGGAQAVAGFHNSYGMWTGSPTAAMPSGVEDMQINGYWNPGDLALTAPHRTFAYTWPAVPASRKGFRFQSTGGHSAFVPQGAKQSDSAFQLIEFLVGDDAEQTIFDSTGWLGARLSFLAKVDVNKYAGLDWFINSAKSNDQLNSIPSNPIENYCSTQWTTALNDVLYGKAQPKDALQQLQEQVTNEMKQRFPNG
jgi:ABC-type glycerol-3-phosphate transport system substrate-binding protein